MTLPVREVPAERVAGAEETMLGGEASTLASAGAAAPLTGRQRFWHRLLRRPEALVSAGFLVIVVLVAAFAPLLAPFEPDQQDLRNALQGPSGEHLLGTDNLGRDTLSRLLFASRVALRASGQATLIALLLGVPLGLFIGYRGGWWDRIVMRLVEAVVAIPGIVVAIAVISILGPGLNNAMIGIGIVYAMAFLRLTRGAVLSVREELYVDSARVVGASTGRIIGRHVLPNVAAPLIVQTTLTLGAALLVEAGLSFLGLGVQPPQASWGAMLADASQFISAQTFLAFPPGIAIALSVLACNLLGDAIRDSVGRGTGGGYVTRMRKERGRAEDALPPERDQRIVIGPSLADEVSLGAASLATPVLAVTDLEVRFPASGGGELTVVSGVSFSVAAGETLGLVGESGCGKTVTAMSAIGLVPTPGRVAGGHVSVAGREVASLSPRELRTLRGTEVGVVFQDPSASLNPAYTISDQIGETLRVHKGFGRRAAHDRSVELLDLVGIPDAKARASSYPHELSGGMAQRAMIAMALANEPKLLIADEPTTALDVTIQGQVLTLLRDIQDEFAMAILFITHDLGVVADICDRAAVMYAGQIVESAPVDGLFLHPQHPYTEGLLRSLPEQSIGETHLPTIPGTVPPPWNWPVGCRFDPRCPYAEEACRRPIALDAARPTHGVRCRRAHELTLEPAR